MFKTKKIMWNANEAKRLTGKYGDAINETFVKMKRYGELEKEEKKSGKHRLANHDYEVLKNDYKLQINSTMEKAIKDINEKKIDRINTALSDWESVKIISGVVFAVNAVRAIFTSTHLDMGEYVRFAIDTATGIEAKIAATSLIVMGIAAYMAPKKVRETFEKLSIIRKFMKKMDNKKEKEVEN